MKKTVLLLLLALAMLAGCGALFPGEAAESASGVPAESPSSVEAPLQSVPSEVPAMDAPASRVPQTEQEALLYSFPATYQELKGREDLVIEAQGELINGRLWEDFRDAAARQTPARVVVARLTVEGQPILYLIDYDGEIFRWYMDASRDAFGAYDRIQSGSAHFLLRLEHDDYVWYILSDEEFEDYDAYQARLSGQSGEDVNWPVELMAIRATE